MFEADATVWPQNNKKVTNIFLVRLILTRFLLKQREENKVELIWENFLVLHGLDKEGLQHEDWFFQPTKGRT